MPMRVMAAVALAVGAVVVGGCGATTTPQSAAEIAVAMQSRGVPLTSVVAFTAATDPEHVLGTVGGPQSRAGWHDPRAPAGDRVNALEVFARTADADRRATELSSRPSVAQYSFVVANVVLRLSHELTNDQAMEYQAALKAVVGS